jgi:hypothetical protein
MMTWRKYLKLGVPGILSGAVVMSILAYAILGSRPDTPRGFAAYRAEQPTPSPK